MAEIDGWTFYGCSALTSLPKMTGLRFSWCDITIITVEPEFSFWRFCGFLD
jgi:hypothetical protein